MILPKCQLYHPISDHKSITKSFRIMISYEMTM